MHHDIPTPDPNDAKDIAEVPRHDSARIEADMLRALKRHADPEPWWHDPAKRQRRRFWRRFDDLALLWLIVVVVFVVALLVGLSAWGREVELLDPPPPPPKEAPLACRTGVLLPACIKPKPGE